jgi:signal transduction histidine kinase
MGDEESLEQVFTNLISNAIKFSKPGGRVRLHLKKDAGFIAVAVEDTGIGIANEHLPFIFDQFYQVRRSQEKKMKGTGLGLSIAKKIIDAHNGTIDVSSEPDVGSTFIVRLPRP